ncbi:MAG: endoglucanase [Chthoniobacter sp.]|nr:endoglucanase [Chthoniobacter sp.]
MRTILAALCAAALVCHAVAQTPSLQVSGKDLLLDGTAVILRGVAVGDPFLARQGRPLSDYATIASTWRANVVRISLHPSVWKHTPHAEVIAKLRAETKAALDAGMCAIIDWHTIGWPDGYYEAIQADWDDPPDLYDSKFALAQSFWDEIAEAFAEEPRVIFELWNEPVFDKREDDNAPVQRWAQLKPYMAQLLATVRAHGDNVVLATSNVWAYELHGIRNDLLPGENIGYAWHIYAGHSGNRAEAWAEALDDLQTVAPVFVTEWGFQPNTKEHFRGSARSFGTKFGRDFLDAKNLHSTAWCWHPEWTPVMLRRDWKTPTKMGAFVLNYLRRHNPAPSEKAN